MKKSVAMARRNPIQTNNFSIKSENSWHPAYCFKCLKLNRSFEICAFVSCRLVVVFVFVLGLWHHDDMPMYQVHKTLCCLINWYPGYKYLNATQQNRIVCAIHSHQNLIDAVMKYSQRCHFHSRTHNQTKLEMISIVSSVARIKIVDSLLLFSRIWFWIIFVFPLCDLHFSIEFTIHCRSRIEYCETHQSTNEILLAREREFC